MHDRFGDGVRGAEGPHAAGVGSLVVVEQALVVLARGEDEDVVPVEECEDRDLCAVDFLFYEDRLTRIAKRLVDEHLACRGDGLLVGLGDDDPLALGEPGSLDDIDLVAGFEELLGLIELLKDASLGGRDRCGPHHLLGVGLVGFEIGALGTGAKDQSR